MENNFLTAEQLADRIGVKPGTVRQWTRDRLIPVMRLSPKVHRYDLDAVLETFKKRQKERGGGDEN
jgi:transcriptional regulator with XRE-family HTH domain